MRERDRAAIHVVVFSGSSPSSFSTALYCGAKASLTSTRSMSAIVSPARASALRAAGAGPMPMIDGSTPANPHAISRPSGSSPRASAQARSATTHAAAPSPIPLAFPAVTSPSFLKYGLSPASTSMVVSGRMCSSLRNSTSPLRLLTVTGVTSASKRPASQARLARCCDSNATRSASSRVTS